MRFCDKINFMDMFMTLLGVIGTLYGLWFVAIGILGSMKRPSVAAHSAPTTRFAVVIPARNEENVVGHLVRSLKNQEYPGKLFDIIVVPNGCTDKTAAAARRAGATVLECDIETHSKGDVLKFAFGKLCPEDKYDAYCVMDADNLAAPGFLRAANAALREGFEIVQGYRDSKNPSDNWVAGDTSIFFWMMNRFFNRARVLLGMSAALNGTGMVLRKSLIERIGWNTGTLTEDLELSAICAINGVKIGYVSDAVVYDEQPVSIRDSVIQRRRWMSGTIQCFRRYALKLLKKRSSHALDMLILFSGCVIQIICLIPGIYSATSVLMSVARGDMPLLNALILGVALIAAAYTGSALFALLICVLERKLTKGRVTAILMFPIFLVTWFPTNIWAMLTPPPKWRHIDHVRSTDSPRN